MRIWISVRALACVLGLMLSGVLQAQTVLVVGEKVASDTQGRAIFQTRVNAVSIAYKLIGKGEPLLLIMGLGGTMEQWPAPLLDALSSHYQLILLDNRGMGHSTANDVPFDYRLFADDVIGLLDALHIAKTNVLGYSMGSTITQALLLDYPQRIDKAVIMAGSLNGANVVKQLQGKPVSDPTVLRQIAATAHWSTPLERMAQVQNPVLVVIGTADEVVGLDSSKTLATTIPGAWLAQFGNGHHGVMREAPEAVAQTILSFMQTNQAVAQKKQSLPTTTIVH